MHVLGGGGLQADASARTRPPIAYADFEECDTLLVAGANPAWCHPILWRRVEARKQADPTVRIIVVDPRVTASCASADLHLQIRPGTDVALHLALARRLAAIGAVDRAFIDRHASGWDQLAAAAEPYTLEHTAAVCGLAAADIANAAEWLAGDRRFLSLWTMGLNQSSVGVDKNASLITLSLITGKIGRPGCGPFSLTGQPNAMGGREVGGMATLASAHRSLADPAHRAEIAAHWGVASVPEKPGLTAVELFQAAREGRIKALWIIATNPVESLPDSWQVEAALRNVELVVAQDCYPTATTAMADVVLPAATWLGGEDRHHDQFRAARGAAASGVAPAPGEAPARPRDLLPLRRGHGLGRELRPTATPRRSSPSTQRSAVAAIAISAASATNACSAKAACSGRCRRRPAAAPPASMAMRASRPPTAGRGSRAPSFANRSEPLPAPNVRSSSPPAACATSGTP